MDEPFGHFGLDPRPWIDPESLRTAFLRLARALHPDSPSGNAAKFSELNAAYHALARPASRLRVLLERRFPDYRPGPGASEDADLFMRVGATLRQSDTLAAKLAERQTALGKAALAGSKKDAIAALECLDRQLAEKEGDAAAQLLEMDSRWPDVSAQEIAALGARFDRMQKWRAELGERKLRLEAS